VTDPPGSAARAQRDDVEALFDERSDPAGAAFATLGVEATSELNWIQLLRHRVRRRAMGSSRYQWWVLWSLLAGLLALNFTFTVFTVNLVRIGDEFGVNQSAAIWVSLGPILAYGFAAPFFGKLGDIFGHRRLYMVGLTGGMVSAIATALAPNYGVLVGARVLDGVMGAATGTASGAIINLVFSREERVKAAGWWSLVGAGGPVIGLSLGGPIIEAWGWRALFWVQLALIVGAFLVVVALLPSRFDSAEADEERRVRARREFKEMDWIGSWTISIAITSLTLGISVASIKGVGWLGWQTLLCFVVSGVFFVLAVYRLTHAENPLIPPHYFTRRNFAWPTVARITGNFAYFGGFWLSALMLQYVWAKSPVQIAGIVIARPILFAISSPIAGYVAIKIGERTTAVIGSLVLVVSMICFWALPLDNWEALMIVALSCSGLGMGVAMPSNGSTMANEVEPKEFGVMTAAQLLTGQAGQVIGAGLLVALQTAALTRLQLPAGALKHPATLTDSQRSAVLGTFEIPFVIAAVFAMVAVVASAMFRSLPRGSRRDFAEADDDAL
jgi:MFS family permease